MKSGFDQALRAFALEASGAASASKAADLVLETLTRSVVLVRRNRTYESCAGEGSPDVCSADLESKATNRPSALIDGQDRKSVV